MTENSAVATILQCRPGFVCPLLGWMRKQRLTSVLSAVDSNDPLPPPHGYRLVFTFSFMQQEGEQNSDCKLTAAADHWKPLPPQVYRLAFALFLESVLIADTNLCIEYEYKINFIWKLRIQIILIQFLDEMYMNLNGEEQCTPLVLHPFSYIMDWRLALWLIHCKEDNRQGVAIVPWHLLPHVSVSRRQWWPRCLNPKY